MSDDAVKNLRALSMLAEALASKPDMTIDDMQQLLCAFDLRTTDGINHQLVDQVELTVDHNNQNVTVRLRRLNWCQDVNVPIDRILVPAQHSVVTAWTPAYCTP